MISTEAARNGRQLAAGPSIQISVDRAAPLELPAAALGEHTDELAQIRDRLVQARRVEVQLHRLAHWPRPAWRALLTLLDECRASCLVEVDGERFGDAFEASVAGLSGPDRPLCEQARTRELAMDAAVALYPDTPELAAARIDERVAELGGTRINTSTLIRRLERLVAAAGPVGGESSGDARQGTSARHGAPDGPQTLADGFLEELRHTAGLSDQDPVLLRLENRWYTYDGKCWRSVGGEQLGARIRHFIAVQGVRPNEGLVHHVLALLGARTQLDGLDIDPPLMIDRLKPPQTEPGQLIALANGLIDVKALATRQTPILLAPGPQYFVPVALPIAYDPDATCPMWERFLEEVLPRSGDGDLRREVVAEFFFYTMLLDCRFERMLILLGSGRNGKSTILRVLRALLGRHNVSHVPFRSLGKRFRLHALARKLANISTESDPLGQIDETLFKQLISGETVNVDRKHHESVDVRPVAKHLVACNELAAFSAADEALWQRLTIVPFTERFEAGRADVRLADKLIANELPGILNWALTAGARLLSQGRFSDCQRCARALTAHRNAGDPVIQFIADACELEPDLAVRRGDLYEAFKRHWRARRGAAGPPPDEARFGKSLRAAVERLGHQIRDARVTLSDQTRPRLYAGIALNPDGRALLGREEASRVVHVRPNFLDSLND